MANMYFYIDKLYKLYIYIYINKPQKFQGSLLTRIKIVRFVGLIDFKVHRYSP